MSFYHRTNVGRAIIESGFVDHGGYYLTDQWWEGVWVSDVDDHDEYDGAHADLVVIEVPESEIAEFEWTGQGKPYREWLVPARVLNRFPRRLVPPGG